MNVLLRSYGSHLLGMGHLYRMRKVACALRGYDTCLTLCTRKFSEAQPIYQNIPYDCLIEIPPEAKEKDELNVMERELEVYYDTIVNDQLNTSLHMAGYLRRKCKRYISFDDNGGGADLADCLVNVLYPSDQARGKEISSFDYLIIDDYSDIKSQYAIIPEVRRIFVNQGAADTWGAIPDILRDLGGLQGDIIIRLLLGPAYKHFSELAASLRGISKKVEIFNHCASVVELAQTSDLAIIGGGNTLFELLSLGVPIVACTREQKELVTIRRMLQAGFVWGQAKLYYDRPIRDAVMSLIENYQERERLYRKNRATFCYTGMNNIITLIME